MSTRAFPTVRSPLFTKTRVVQLACLVAVSAATMSSTVQAASGASETTIRQLNPSVTTFSAPFVRTGAEVGVRMSAIKLDNGDLVLYNPTELDTQTKAKLESLGTVRYIVAPNIVHHTFIDPYHAAYPQAKLIGPEGISDKKKIPFMELKEAAESGAYTSQIGWGNDLQLQYFPDFSQKEIMLFHTPTKTLFVGDMLWNLPANEAYTNVNDKTRQPVHQGQFSVQHAVDHHLNPEGWLGKALQWTANKPTDALKAGLKRAIYEWQPQTIVMQHGDVITSDARGKLESTFSYVKQ